MIALQSNIEKSILKGVQYLHQHQYPNGEFCCYIGHEDHLKDTIPQSQIFPTSLICYSLLHLQHLPEVKEILDRSAAFLQFQLMRAGVWNHFTSWSPLFKLCPADADNTSCASKVLQSLKKDFPNNEKILLANRSRSGLFYTWYTLRPNMVWIKDYWLLILREFKYPLQSLFFWKSFECNRNDIDAVVNANVLFYLGLNTATQPIVNYLLEIIDQQREADCDKWYRNPFTIYYFFSRIYKEGINALAPAAEKMEERILATSKINGSFGESILDTALGIISLVHLNHRSPSLDEAVNFLIEQQNSYGNWPRWAVYYGGPKKLSCFGSEELTTGFCLEALALYQKTKPGYENT